MVLNEVDRRKLTVDVIKSYSLMIPDILKLLYLIRFSIALRTRFIRSFSLLLVPVCCYAASSCAHYFPVKVGISRVP